MGVLAMVAGTSTPASGLEPGVPVVSLQEGTNGCNGVRTTPGSENTDKALDPAFPSDFNPGGVVGFVIDYPVDPEDVTGRDTFVITDCVFVDDEAVVQYTVSFVPNTEAFQLRYSVPIPAGTPLGAEFCNYAKTTAAPSTSQASNRKAGPACFVVGGALRIEKRSGSTTGPLLGGASFSVLCTPDTGAASQPTIITGLSQTSQSNSDGTVTASGTSATGVIAISGPSGTPCSVTETAAPAGYQLDSTPRSLVIPIGTGQTIEVFVNLREVGTLVVDKTTTGGTGTFTFDVDCDGTAFDRALTITGSGSASVTGIPVGTACTVTERANSLFSSVVTPTSGAVTIAAGTNTVSFTNTRNTGSLVVSKTTEGGTGTFTFDVDCEGTAHDQTVTVTGSGSQTITGIPTATTCTVTERSTPLFASESVPAGGTVDIGISAVTVSFRNTARPTGITLDKLVNGGDHATAADALVVHAGDPLTYTVDIRNSGEVPVDLLSLTDSLEPGFAAACPQGVGSTLAAGASFTCTYPATASGTSTNVAAVVAVDGLGRRSSASDSAFVQVINPLLTITKTPNPPSVSENGVVTFTYVVTNTGDTPLKDVTVTDDVLGGIGVVGDLAPGASATLTKNQTVTASSPTRNVGTATGVDLLGRKVSASAVADITIVLGLLLELPRTGGPISLLATAGFAMVVAGLALVAGGRRRRQA